MYYNLNPRNTVNGWGVNHPKDVRNALDCLRELDNAHAVEPDWSGIFDPATVAETVQAHAAYNASQGEPRSTALERARKQLEDELTDAVTVAFDGYVKQWEERFNAAAKQYTAAAELLPREFNAEDTAAFTVQQFQALQDAKSAAVDLKIAESFLLSSTGVVRDQSFNDNLHATEFLIMDPGSVDLYVAVTNTTGSGYSDPVYASVEPVLLKAVKDGATLRLATPNEATDCVNDYEQQCQAMRDDDYRKVVMTIKDW